MQIEIVTVGNEILSGFVVNTNTVFLSRRLSEEGWHVHHHTTLPDQKAEMITGLQLSLARSEVVIVTGGLGSTLDDITKECVDRLFIDSPQEIPNSVGSAPGLKYRERGKTLFCLPGIPQEMEGMFEKQVLPFLKEHYPLLHTLCHRTWNFFTLSENEIDPFLRLMQAKDPTLRVGIYPSYGQLTLRLTGENTSTLDEIGKELQTNFGQKIFPSIYKNIEEALHDWFIKHHKTLAFAESCTGGLLASHITAMEGASSYFVGSLVTYSNACKENVLGVVPSTIKLKGAVSKETVQEMLEGLFEKTGADYGIAVSGIAGPTGGSAKIPVGTIWYAIGKKGGGFEISSFLAKGKSRGTILAYATKRLFGGLYRMVMD